MFHQLELKLIQQVNKSSINTDEIKRIIDQLLVEEIYITIRDDEGNTF
jgi:hypothetical protein